MSRPLLTANKKTADEEFIMRVPVGHRWSSHACDRCGQENVEWSRRGPNSNDGAWWSGCPTTRMTWSDHAVPNSRKGTDSGQEIGERLRVCPESWRMFFV